MAALMTNRRILACPWPNVSTQLAKRQERQIHQSEHQNVIDTAQRQRNQAIKSSQPDALQHFISSIMSVSISCGMEHSMLYMVGCLMKPFAA